MLLAGCFASAATVDSNPLPDPAQEARAQSIMHELRCLVCQNQSIAESEADLARDLRTIVRERIKAGDSDDQVKHYLVARYGDWVLMKPPLEGRTALLWFWPLAVLAAGAFGLWRWLRRPRAPAQPLNDAEKQALDKVLRGDGA